MKRVRPCQNPDCENTVPRPRRLFCCERCSMRVHHAKERERKALARAAGQVIQPAPVLRRESSVIAPGRVCHDCGIPETQYRCAKCWRRLRQRLGISEGNLCEI